MLHHTAWGARVSWCGVEGGGKERGDVAGAGPVSPLAHGSLWSLCGVSTGELRFGKYVLVVESGHAVAPGRN